MNRSRRRAMAGAALVSLGVTACADQPTAPSLVSTPAPSLAVTETEESGLSQFLTSANVRAAKSGVAIARAELLTTSTADLKTPRLLFANDRTLRLTSGWVPRDIRRLSTDATLSYAVFAPNAKATVGGAAGAAFESAMATWNGVPCSNLTINKRELEPGRLPSYFRTGGLFPPADINVVGFLPGTVFDSLAPGGSQSIVAVTLTATFVGTDAQGRTIPTDVDGDGRMDTAFKEIWFNDALGYSTVGAPGTIDIESAILHEFGHALELGHFGKIVGDPKTGKLHVSPRAVMNAANLGTQRTLLGSDNAAFCGTYANWQ